MIILTIIINNCENKITKNKINNNGKNIINMKLSIINQVLLKVLLIKKYIHNNKRCCP